MTFQVGDKVVCVDDSPSPRGGDVPLKLNAIYTIAGNAEPDYFGFAGVFLNEELSWSQRHDCGRYGFRASRFRAAESRTEIPAFTAIKPVKENA